MSSRLSPKAFTPDGYHGLIALGQYVAKSDLEPALIELVKMRASQINGCALCLAMHARDFRALGESEMRLHVLPAWREAPFYTERERAALAWTEAVTRLTDGDVPDDVYEPALAQFGEKGLIDLTYAIIAINGWNRLNVAFRRPPLDD